LLLNRLIPGFTISGHSCSRISKSLIFQKRRFRICSKQFPSRKQSIGRGNRRLVGGRGGGVRRVSYDSNFKFILNKTELAKSVAGLLYGEIMASTESNNSVALVRERTIPTERPPLVGEVGAKF
jgi:hypothetical protein